MQAAKPIMTVNMTVSWYAQMGQAPPFAQHATLDVMFASGLNGNCAQQESTVQHVEEHLLVELAACCKV